MAGLQLARENHSIRLAFNKVLIFNMEEAVGMLLVLWEVQQQAVVGLYKS